MQRGTFRHGIAILVALALGGLPSSRARAHCDSLEGPVVQDAREALENGDPTSVMKWVGEAHEGEVREAFARTMAVRRRDDEARALADRHLFETLVRLHRAGEGEAFTGLKPASGVDPGIAAADEALRAGSATDLAERLSAALAEGVRKRFAIALERRKRASDSIAAGRRYVDAYVDYVHFVESIERLVAQGASHRHHEPGATTHTR